MQIVVRCVDNEKPPNTSVVRELAGGGSVSVMRMRDLAEMGLGGLLVAVVAILASASASSWPGTYWKVIGPGRALRSDTRL